ncbi:glycerophosphodiester phosphodiesterase family protein [Cycloclasticus sp. P1]|jgi:glycerophosphoryl diester phosphodiesterase|uniref:glycerophosphodiester phosphodiesterase n=1 Tax=Cycloclasticus sp. (strain P1) TaxID=385025 RepID=UPI000286AB29|nr:glycerophosphodiester phosphodiesterase family protein [Cycloclasticus sp. P1]AFT67385.1 Glycerophosphoryl diester phosphodiesterase family protein [Cycloclasticus sp. P1]
MLMIGHRGAMGCAPENTLLSIHKAIELGADWVEIDVHCVADKLLVIHDETVDRTTNGRGKLIDYSFEELRALDAGLGQRIPTLQEVLEVTVGKVGLNIELKGLGTGKVLTSLLRNTPETYKNKMLVSSFLMPELEQVVRLNQHVKIGVLAGNNINESIAWATKLKAFSIHLRLQKVTPKWVDRAHDLGLKVYVYTVNKVVQIRRMKELGVDGVFSDYPNRLTS